MLFESLKYPKDELFEPLVTVIPILLPINYRPDDES